MEKTFKERVLEAVKHIPKGQTKTYKEVAIKAGSPNAARAVGNIMHNNFDPTVPCHRVIKSNGSVGGYNRGPKAKIARLKEENATFRS